MKVILTTCEPSDAERLLRSLLEERVVACGNIINQVRSLYWWDGQIQDDKEVVIIMETTDEKEAAAIAAIERQHPYSVPKILAWEPSHVHAPYLQWLQKETQS